MQAEVACKFGMERCEPTRARPAEHGMAVVLGEHVDVLPDSLDDRRADEHALERRPREVAHGERRLEGLALAAVAVAADAHVEHAERLLVGTAVDDLARA